MPPAIEVKDLVKHYGDFEAVRGISFEVAQGEVFGLLGPNGAGKTTTVEIMEGLRMRTSGEVSVLGLDPAKNAPAVKDRIGVSLQATNLPDKITVLEALVLFSSFYSRTTDAIGILERLQLSDKRDTYYSKLSGGQKQRVALALALVNDPQLVFLDEPTTGLDPQVRHEIHTLIQELRGARKTILLTTHYIEEAERLCDRVAIIDEGRIISIGTPKEIQARTLVHSHIDLRFSSPLPEVSWPSTVEGDYLQISADRLSLSVSSERPTKTLVELIKRCEASGVEVQDIQLQRPTLEDVFIELTGKKLRE